MFLKALYFYGHEAWLNASDAWGSQLYPWPVSPEVINQTQYVIPTPHTHTRTHTHVYFVLLLLLLFGGSSEESTDGGTSSTKTGGSKHRHQCLLPMYADVRCTDDVTLTYHHIPQGTSGLWAIKLKC